jgi:hypothetical protein
MKTFNIEITYYRDSFNGYEYTDRINYTIDARNEKSAINKAKKKFPKWYGTIRGIQVVI